MAQIALGRSPSAYEVQERLMVTIRICRLRALLDTRQQHLEQELAAIQRLEAQAHH